MQNLEARNVWLARLSLGLMKHVIAGHTYEREAIEAWMKHNRFSPVTKKPLPDRRVIPNLLVKQATTIFWGNRRHAGTS